MRYMHLSPAARQDAIGLVNTREEARTSGERFWRDDEDDDWACRGFVDTPNRSA